MSSLAYKIIPALFASALLLSPAAAAPVGPNTMTLPDDSLVTQVRDGGHGHGGRGHGGGHRGGKGHHGNKGHGHHGGRHHGHGGWKHGHGGWNHGGHWHGRGGWVAGRTYYVAPPGWRQYGGRPWNWQALGCVVVNGFWFCP
jgi:hypothetical protein